MSDKPSDWEAALELQAAVNQHNIAVAWARRTEARIAELEAKLQALASKWEGDALRRPVGLGSALLCECAEDVRALLKGGA